MKIINRYTISALCLLVLGVSLGLYLWWPQAVKPTFRQVHFKHLPGWNKASFTKSLQAFQVSCRAFVKHDPERVVGTDAISLQAKDWQPACHAALAMSDSSEQLAKLFFEQWFAPVEFYGDKPVNGLFTGYYMPSLKGSYTKTAEYNVPLYQVPSDMLTIDLELFLPHAKNKKIIGRLAGNKIVPYFTREQINNGALKDKAKVLMWIRDPVDRLFLEIQGSGIVELDDGSRVFVGYDGQHGA
ncbi:MAG: MltA domain-containing protein, partial [Legionella sp.]